MILRKYLLAGGLASILVLGACEEGALEEEPEDDTEETVDTESDSQVDDEPSDDPLETIEESGETVDEDEIDHDSTETETEADNTADDAGEEDLDDEDSE